MLRTLVLLMLLSSTIFAKNENMNKSSIQIKADTTEETVQIFYEFAVNEYEYANYGFSRDIFTAISNRSSKYPGCYYFLGKIYEEVALFKDPIMSKQCYLKAATSKELASHLRQDSYAALIRLTEDPEIAMKYAEASFKLGDSDNSKVALILAYHKKYDKTRDESYLDRADIVNRSMTDRFFNGSSVPVIYNSSLLSGK